MSDGRLRPDDDAELVTRLEGWFSNEVQRARADIANASQARTGTAVHSGHRLRMASWLAPMVVVVIVVAGTLAAGAALRRDPPNPPIGDASATPNPAVPEVPELPTIDITGWYWDGVPASINHELVSRTGEVARVDGGSGSGLVGGWVASTDRRCGLRAECPADGLRGSPKEGPITPIVGPDIVPPRGHIAVYRTEDTGSRLVWSADPAGFVQQRYADGIPTHLDGIDVHQVSDLEAVLAQTPDDRPILVAGWFRQFGLRCAYVPDRQKHVLLPYCNGAQLARGPGTSQQPLIQGVPVLLDGLDLDWGRVVLRVHHRDARSASCLPHHRSECEAAIVVEAVVWSGDEWTETMPLGIADVVERLGSAGLVRNVIPTGTAGGTGGCRPDFPPEMWTPVFEDSTVGSPIARILVFASVADRVRVGASLRTDGVSGHNPDGTSCLVIVDGLTARAWVAVDNVIVEVPYLLGEDPEETQERIDAVEAALRGE